MALIELAGVRKSFPVDDDSELVILSGVDLSIGAREHVSIVGRSGSGKSTLLNILGMLDNVSGGTYRFDGVDVAGFRSGARDRARGREIGFIFQQFNLLAGRTALENVAMPLLYSSGRRFWQRRIVAAEMLERVGLGGRLDAMPHTMSGGEQQRVAIARALVRRPRAILADEPTGALDIGTASTVMSLLDEVAAACDAALITITHDPAVAARAERSYVLDAGVLEVADMSVADQTDRVVR